MRNLKRVLALALALVMVIGMMVMGASAASYTDADSITDNYSVAVDVMSGVGMFEGNEGNFMPSKTLTQAEAAGLMARLMLGKTAADNLVASQQLFSDVPVDHWAAGEIEYCATLGLIAGDGTGKFNPDKELTGIALAKLILVAAGYDAVAQGYVGANWAANISVDARANKLMVNGVLLSATVTREVAAQMLYQALTMKTVTYRTSYDYATGAATLVGPNVSNTKFMTKYFPNLEKVEGVIESVAAKYTYLGTEKVSATNVDWTDIGYYAYSWVLNGTKEDVATKTSISDIIITGESLAVSTCGYANALLTDSNYFGTGSNPYQVATVDADECYVYYNGVKKGAYDSEPAKTALAVAAKVGAKIDYIDNDNEGWAEAIVVTEYTYDKVDSVTRKSVSGVVSDYQYNTASKNNILASKLANVDALAKGDHISYVVYGGKYYVTVLDAEIMTLDSITRTKLSDTLGYQYCYEFDGDNYITSELNYTVLSELVRANIDEEFTVVLDEYGYIVYAAVYTDPNAYLYVLGNNHTDSLDGTTKTAVVYGDGTKENVYVSTVYSWDSAKKEYVEDDDFDNGEIKETIYSYGVDKYGNYVLVEVADAKLYEDSEYTNKQIKFDTLSVNNDNVIVDLRTKTFGTVYVGHTELPSMLDGDIVWSDIARLGFLLKGTDPSSKKASFVVFNDEVTIERVSGVAVTYTLEEGVLVNGELVAPYELTAAQKADVVENGLGVYSWNAAGELTFTSFEEDTVYWTPESSGTLIYKDQDITEDYEAVIISAVYEEVGYWWQLVAEGEYYCYIDKTNKVIYIIGDGTTTENIGTTAAPLYVKELLGDPIKTELTTADFTAGAFVDSKVTGDPHWVISSVAVADGKLQVVVTRTAAGGEVKAAANVSFQVYVGSDAYGDPIPKVIEAGFTTDGTVTLEIAVPAVAGTVNVTMS